MTCGFASASWEFLCLSVSIGALVAGVGVSSSALAASGVAGARPVQADQGAKAASAQKPAQADDASAQSPAPAARFDIDDFAVEGADRLPQVEIEEALYPFLGPN